MHTIVAIAEQMKQDITIAIAADQMFRPAASDNKLIKCFDNVGLAATAFYFLRHMLLSSQVMALMRLWDDDDSGKVHSISALVNQLSDDALVGKVSRTRTPVDRRHPPRGYTVR